MRECNSLVGCYNCSDNQVLLSVPGVQACECLPGWIKRIDNTIAYVDPVSCTQCPGTSVSSQSTHIQTSSKDRLFCIQCPGVTASNELSKTCVCPPNEYLDFTPTTQVSAIPLGECKPCESGYYPSADISECLPCPQTNLMIASPVGNVSDGSPQEYACTCRTDLGYAEAPVNLLNI